MEEFKIKFEVINLLREISKELKTNSNKISEEFVKKYANKCTYEYGKIGDSARVCVMTTTTGNKIIDSALVLDPNNDVEEIGNRVARERCQEQLWSFLGSMAKMLEV